MFFRCIPQVRWNVHLREYFIGSVLVRHCQVKWNKASSYASSYVFLDLRRHLKNIWEAATFANLNGLILTHLNISQFLWPQNIIFCILHLISYSPSEVSNNLRYRTWHHDPQILCKCLFCPKPILNRQLDISYWISPLSYHETKWLFIWRNCIHFYSFIIFICSVLSAWNYYR